MNRKTLLIILLIVQAGIIAFLYRPGQEAKVPDRALFDTLQIDKLTAMTITDDQDKNISLVLVDNKWQVGQGQFPGDTEAIDAILQKIAGLKSSRVVTRTKSSQGRLKVADSNYNRKIMLNGVDTNTVFYIGTAPNSKSIHLRIEGESQVYQVMGISSWELAAEQDSWWQSKYVKQDTAKLTGLELMNPMGKFGLQRGAEDAWQLADSDKTSLDQSKLDKLVDSVSRLSVDTYLDKGYQVMGKPIAKITYHMEGLSYTLEIWDKNDENGEHVVKRSDAKFFAKIKAYILKDILVAQSANLIVNEDTSETATPNQE